MKHTPKLKIFALLSLIALTFSFALPALASDASDKWIHVRINGDNDENVSINLPFSVLTAAVKLIPAEVNDEAEIALDDLNMTWSELRDFWHEVKSAPEATFISVESRDETVRVKKQGDFVVVQTDEGSEGAEIDVKFPLAVVDALLSGPDNTLDFEGALTALADYGPNNLVSIRDGNETIRVWIDDVSPTE